MSAHTPGPWESDGAVIAWQGGRLPATRVAYNSSPTVLSPIAMCIAERVGDKESICNARLIAAAPDMLTALQAVVASLAEQDDEGLIEHAEPMVAARAAIAKATQA